MFLLADAGVLLEELKGVPGVLATALVSQNGLAVRASVPTAAHAETCAIMWAMAYGAARTACAELGRAVPESLTVEGPDSRTTIARVGDSELIVAVLDLSANPSRVLEELTRAVASRSGDGRNS